MSRRRTGRDGPVKIDRLPLSGVSREFALPDFPEALLEAPSGFGRRRVEDRVTFRPSERGGVVSDE